MMFIHIYNKVRFFIQENGIMLSLVFLAVTPCLLILIANISLLTKNNTEISSYPETPYDLAVIFGGGMQSDSEQSKNQKERVAVGTFFYKKGIASKLLITGDDGSYKIDEITYMKNQAVFMGVPIYALEIHGTGYRTIKSCEYLSTIISSPQTTRIIAISNGYHLPRINYLCDFFGVKVDTVAIEDVIGEERQSSEREVFARVKGFIEVHLLIIKQRISTLF